LAGLGRFVLDASALLAYLQGESGSQTVAAALPTGPLMNIVNYAEVLSRLADGGEDPAYANRRLAEEGLIGGLIELVPVTEQDAVEIARLRVRTRGQGISLADRACLATALRAGRTALTADHSWAALSVGAAVELIR
jgi:PIN domain nuclease of toxin-antitoxin system